MSAVWPKCVLMSDHIFNGGHCLNVDLSMLFNCMVMYGVSAASLGAAVSERCLIREKV